MAPRISALALTLALALAARAPAAAAQTNATETRTSPCADPSLEGRLSAAGHGSVTVAPDTGFVSARARRRFCTSAAARSPDLGPPTHLSPPLSPPHKSLASSIPRP